LVLATNQGGKFTDGYNSFPYAFGSRSIVNDGNDVIIVAMNYRVGAFGFLSSEELAKEGSLNPGLLDVEAAFKWTRKYVSAFGGNPKDITAYGLSSGAMITASLLLAKDGSLDLFERAILMSGSILPVIDTPTATPWVFEHVATSAKCTGANKLDCLRKMKAEDLLKVSIETTEFMNSPLTTPFFPVIDGKYFTRQHSEGLSIGKFRKVPLMVTFILI
jgi:carboxylesterase type B